MFTGIITNLGKIKEKKGQSVSIQADRKMISKLEKGTSIAVDGICLTVLEKGKDYFVIDFMQETKDLTNIKHLDTGSIVNLELPVTAESLLSGHLVQGHIDGLGKLIETKGQTNSKILKFSVGPEIAKYLVKKGSISVNGVSLTLIDANRNYFTVGIIPYTWENTALSTLKLEDFVNIEVDVLAKYVERLLK